MFWPFELLGGFAVVAFIIAIATTIIWIWALVDCLQNPRLEGTEKLIWALVILFLHIVGAILYFVIGRQQRLAGS